MKCFRFVIFSSCLSLVCSQAFFTQYDQIGVKDGIRIWFIEDNTEELCEIAHPNEFSKFDDTTVYIILNTSTTATNTVEHDIYYLSRYGLQEIPIRKELLTSVETREIPTLKFKNLFRRVLDPTRFTPIKRMYRMERAREWRYITQVPPHYKELDLINLFLLQEQDSNQIHILNIRNERKTKTTKKEIAAFTFSSVLAHNAQVHMYENEISARQMSYVLDCSDMDFDIEDPFQIPFFNEPLDDDIRLIQFTLSANKDVEEIKLERTVGSLIYDDNNVPNSEDCFILIKERVKEAFMYIGEEANYEVLNYILKFGEYEYSDFRLSVVQENNIPPAFGIAFEKYISTYYGIGN